MHINDFQELQEGLFNGNVVTVVVKRSPVLGYNHNIRYRGLVFHIQTEDSGVANPHIFTHLFHGGVILTSRKHDYDASFPELRVKMLMQEQHKQVLRDLKKGKFRDKIDSYLGNHPDLVPSPLNGEGKESAIPAPLPPAESLEIAQPPAKELDSDSSGGEQPPVSASEGHSAPSFPSLGIPATISPSDGPTIVDSRLAAFSEPEPRSAHKGQSGDVSQGSKPGRVHSNVIVAGPPRVVGKPQRPLPPTKPGAFGQGVISERSLDEVILAYLSEDGHGE